MKLLTKYLKPLFSYSLRSPINIKLLNSDQGKKTLENSLNARFKNSTVILPQLSQSYEKFRKTLNEFETLSREANNLKKTIKDLVKNKKQQQLQSFKNQLAEKKQHLILKQNQLKQVQKNTEKLLLSVGNIVSSETPISKNQDDNKVIKYYHPHLQNTNIEGNINSNHAQIVKKYFSLPSPNNPQSVSYEKLNNLFKISDLQRGQKVSGHRGYFLCTNGVKLALAIAQYGMDFLEKKGYDLYQTPALILEDVLLDSCQLQTLESDMYRLPKDNLCLIATSEQSLAGYYRGETLQTKTLPLRMGGYSSCFRRQAGAHGKDIHGLFRLHQFQKVEQFVLCHPNQSQNQMKRMLQTSQEFYQSLNIPYRVVDIVSGELNDPAIRKLDIQAWFPSQKRFRQLVSISNCTDYQSRLLQTKYREGVSTKYVHMLNGTLVAVQRAITCFTQHFYNSNSNTLDIPEALQPYLRLKAIQKPK